LLVAGLDSGRFAGGWDPLPATPSISRFSMSSLSLMTPSEHTMNPAAQGRSG
jgi:hypothetical protein